MTRGNQRDNDRAKAQKKANATKGKNTQTGSQFQKAKEDAASIMREKQRKGTFCATLNFATRRFLTSGTADEKKAAEAAGKK
ncbi:hypothetical protein N7504_010595 [Penicillium tannophilum]|nr:hypothetical protein N7504_010595 [Penicillium tannophilum]